MLVRLILSVFPIGRTPRLLSAFNGQKIPPSVKSNIWIEKAAKSRKIRLTILSIDVNISRYAAQ